MGPSAEIRERLATELRLDLIGPSHRDTELVTKILPDPPSRWYLTGFLVPVDAPVRTKARDPQEEMDTAEEGGADDNDTPDRSAGAARYLPSSMGLSLLVEPGAERLQVTVRWGDYCREVTEQEDGRKDFRWQRDQRTVLVDIPLSAGAPVPLPDSGGLEIARHIRPTQIRDEVGNRDVVAVSLFLVNRRSASADDEDSEMIFQAEVKITGPTIVARADLSGRDGNDPDSRIADLQYRDVVDWAVERTDVKTSTVGARIFPTWFLVQEAEQTGPGGQWRRRRLVRWSDLNSTGRFPDDQAKSRPKKVIPVRFVCGCPAGHLDDIDWRVFVHGKGPSCGRRMWIEERGTTGDIADTWIGCECGVRARSLYDALAIESRALGTCQGKRPWLGPNTEEDCKQPYRLLVRSASNAYFPQIFSVLSLPEEDPGLTFHLPSLPLRQCPKSHDCRYARFCTPCGSRGDGKSLHEAREVSDPA
jgi:hypothetical protein